jgi:hypothetical protein
MHSLALTAAANVVAVAAASVASVVKAVVAKVVVNHVVSQANAVKAVAHVVTTAQPVAVTRKHYATDVK